MVEMEEKTPKQMNKTNEQIREENDKSGVGSPTIPHLAGVTASRSSGWQPERNQRRRPVPSPTPSPAKPLKPRRRLAVAQAVKEAKDA